MLEMSHIVHDNKYPPKGTQIICLLKYYHTRMLYNHIRLSGNVVILSDVYVLPFLYNIV